MHLTHRTVWSELTLGVLVVASIEGSGGCRSYVASRRSLDSRPMTRRERLIAERLGRGCSRKAIGHELGLSATTVGRAIEAAAEKLGVGAMDLVVLAAAFGPGGGRGSVTAIDDASDLLRAPLDASEVWTRFSLAERDVVVMALDGLSSTLIARRRGDRSERTIANQLAHVFRKAEVSGRAELAARLLIG
jgi:DNA-binding NarL/FixJ family response regulator